MGRWISTTEEQGLQDRMADLERQVDHLREGTEQWRTLHHRAQESYDKLIHTVVEMRREGFTPSPVGGPQTLDLHLPDNVMAAIEARSQGVPELERKLIKWALTEVRDDPEGESVAFAILQGGSPPDEDE